MLVRYGTILLCGLVLIPRQAVAQQGRSSVGLERSLRLVAASDSIDVARLRSIHQVPESGMAGTVAFRLARADRGRPVYLATHNLAAGLYARVPDTRSGGWVGTNLTGNGVTVGVWDAGTAREDHVEFGGRVVTKPSVDASATHATHVTGTVAALGLRSEAVGIAPDAQVLGLDWQNDEVRMAQHAAAGLRVSNHSYGTFGGWVEDLRGTGRWTWMGDPGVSSTEEFRFGFYGPEAAAWDAIAETHPNYVIVKSAGNERADTGPPAGTPYDFFDDGWRISSLVRAADGGLTGFDTILDAGVAKNVLTVGAVEDLPGTYGSPDDVRMTTFSGFGPTDDGRVKPDLVANGTSVLSTTAGSPESYGYSSGTSMAAPVVTGVVALLQQAWAELVGGSPSAAMIRGLLIHSADEAGPYPGPDYQFGWGLLNAGSAAALIVDQQGPGGILLVGTVQAGESISFPVHVGGDGELKATLTWTDPAAATGEVALNNRAPVLVNDLDLRVEGTLGPHFPWVLDPDYPSAPASRAENRVDNVEQVHVTGLPEGEYAAVVSLSASAAGPQTFALVVGPARRGITGAGIVAGRLTMAGAPVGGVNVRAGDVQVRSAEDGSFLLPGLSPGHHTIVPEARYGFEPDTAFVVVPEDAYVEFAAASAVRFSEVRLFSSPALLRPDEAFTRTAVTSATPGGTYGLNLYMVAAPGIDLTGGRVVLEFAAAPQTASYAGSLAHRLRQTLDWRIGPAGDARFHKRVPVLWVNGDAAQSEVSIPASILDAAGRLAGRDTVRFSSMGTDDVPPLVFPRIDVAGRGLALPGQGLIIRADAIDGSAITQARAELWERRADAFVGAAPMFDDGEWSRHGDAVAGDRLFGTIYTPDRELDVRVDFRFTDAVGNTHTHRGGWYFSSRTFVRSAPYLLVTFSESTALTDLHRDGLDAAGIAHDSWEFDVRGQIPDSLLDAYAGVLWSWHEQTIERTADIDQIAALVSADSPLVVLGRRIAEGDALSRAGVPVPVGSVATSEAFGSAADSVWAGAAVRLSTVLDVPTWSADQAIVILEADGQPVAVQSGRLVLSGISPPSLDEADRPEYLRRLLYSATGDPGLAGLPTSRARDTPTGAETVGNPYPNPSRGTARIPVSLARAGPVRIELFDILGRRVAVVTDRVLPSGSFDVSIDLASLTPGVYLLALRTPRGAYTRRLVRTPGGARR